MLSTKTVSVVNTAQKVATGDLGGVVVTMVNRGPTDPVYYGGSDVAVGQAQLKFGEKEDVTLGQGDELWMIADPTKTVAVNLTLEGVDPATKVLYDRILDDFLRVDENPLSQSSAWGSQVDAADVAVKLLSHVGVATSAAAASSYRTDISSVDFSVEAKVATLPGNGKRISLFGRVASPDAGGLAGYRLDYVVGTGWRIHKVTNGVATPLSGAAVLPRALGVGQWLKFEGVGSKLIGFWSADGAQWSKMLECTDATVTAAGVIGFGMDDATVTVSAFGGGTNPNAV